MTDPAPNAAAGDGKASTTSETADSLKDATERMRQTTTWLIGAFAAVGAIVFANIAFSDIGSVDVGTRLWAAIAGAALALAGVVFAIWSASRVPTVAAVGLDWLSGQGDGQATVIESISREAWGGDHDRSPGSLQQAILDLDDDLDRLETVEGAEADAEYAAAVERQRHLIGVRTAVIREGSYWRTVHVFNHARQVMVGGAIATVVGVGVFSWGTAAADPIAGGEVLPKTPSNVTVILTDDGIAAFTDVLGVGCTSPIDGIAFEVDYTSYSVTTVKTDTCASASIVVTPDLGDVVPRIAAASGDGDESGG